MTKVLPQSPHPIWLCAAMLLVAAPEVRAQAAPSKAELAKSQVSSEVLKDLAPSGKLRAAINFGNSVLAQRDPAGGDPRGTSADLARELARRLSVPIEYVTFDAAGRVFEALKTNAWDIAFLAVEPVRAAEITFSPPYVNIEGTYLVRSDSPLKVIADVDRPGIRIAVGRGSAYDLFLSRTLKSAELVRAPTSPAAIELFVSDKLEAAAGVKQPIVAYAKANSGMRAMEGRFQVIEQAMGTPKGREAGARFVRDFIEEMKASGFVAAALQRSNQSDAAVAPPATP